MGIRYEAVTLLVLGLDGTAVLVEWRADVEDMQNGRDDDVQHGVSEVPPRTLPDMDARKHTLTCSSR